MSLLPSWVENIQIVSGAEDTLQAPVEYGIDFASGRMTGKKVTEKEAIKCWIWNCIKTERYKYAIYSDQYGVELEQYIGQVPEREYIQTDIQQDITDALMQNQYITAVRDFDITFGDDDINIALTVDTLYGSIEYKDEDFVVLSLQNGRLVMYRSKVSQDGINFILSNHKNLIAMHTGKIDFAIADHQRLEEGYT